MMSQMITEVTSPQLLQKSQQLQMDTPQYMLTEKNQMKTHQSHNQNSCYESPRHKIQYNNNINFDSYQSNTVSPQIYNNYYQNAQNHQIANSRFLQKSSPFNSSINNEKEHNNLDYLVIEPSSNINNRSQFNNNEDIQQNSQQLQPNVESESLIGNVFAAQAPQFCKNNSLISTDTDQFWNKIITNNNEYDEEKNLNSFNNSAPQQLENYSLIALQKYEDVQQNFKEKAEQPSFQRVQYNALSLTDGNQADVSEKIHKMNDLNVFENEHLRVLNLQKDQEIQQLFQLKSEKNYLQNCIEQPQQQLFINEENGYQSEQEKIQQQQQLQQSQLKDKIEENFLIKIDEFQKQDRAFQINQEDLQIEKSQNQINVCNENNNINDQEVDQLKKYKNSEIQYTQTQKEEEEEEDFLFNFQKPNNSTSNSDNDISLAQKTSHQVNYKLNNPADNSDLNNSQTLFQNNNQNFSQINSNVTPSFHYQQIDFQNIPQIPKQDNQISSICCKPEMTKSTSQSDQPFQQHKDYSWQNNSSEQRAMMDNSFKTSIEQSHQYSDQKFCCPVSSFPYDNQLQTIFPHINQNTDQIMDESLQLQQQIIIPKQNSQLQQSEQQQQQQMRQPQLSIKGIARMNQQHFESNLLTKQNHLLHTEQQINIADYVFLNGNDVLQRIHFRGRTDKELQNIIQSTKFKIQNLTLNHNGLHFKSSPSQLYQATQKQYDHQISSFENDKSIRENLNSTNYQICQAKTIYNDWDYKRSNKSDHFQRFSQQLNKKSNEKIPVAPLNSKIRIKLGNELLVQSVISQQTQMKQDQDNNLCLSGLNSQEDSRYIQMDQEYGYCKDLDSNQQQDRDMSRSNVEEDESFVKSSNLTSEQWHCIQQLQKHKKKNVAKNIMTAFKNFISNPTKFGYSQQQIESALSYYNKTKKIYESFDEMQSKFLKYIVKKKFNHYTIKLLIQHPNYGEVFEYFLKQLSDFWLEQSKVHDIEAHLAMINFLKEAYNDIEIIAQLKKYDKRKY
ncbi:hypothetical protein TTHERM_00675730 (macronuclear) [Tetrahymena thermophila SB210]|uniref:Uncharacterized protein n=1 Tax=Tetrahymena thermophila (strain SB210) TaxID=312017 RepID=Q23DY7_TETTS|nr:hypothetical protein TTHERM_00675730 [Tetrahymena thermophila SB210]EAR94800.2 hypothetical protein TTHERM_00675730 [Tetrahymena thermophila SB210]|eukprot:XP_001015045.2 hypothetical protein TTHERM_00675730 [Tetrahymena thermophila SB210]